MRHGRAVRIARPIADDEIEDDYRFDEAYAIHGREMWMRGIDRVTLVDRDSGAEIWRGPVEDAA